MHGGFGVLAHGLMSGSSQGVVPPVVVSWLLAGKIVELRAVQIRRLVRRFNWQDPQRRESRRRTSTQRGTRTLVTVAHNCDILHLRPN